jgi:small subunit ribosomal protein S17
MKKDKKEKMKIEEKTSSKLGRSEEKMKIEEKTEIVRTSCHDKDCPTHGNISIRGRIFEGKVIKKFAKRVVIEFERMIYVRKYERYAKSRTKIHARLPSCMEKSIEMGDLIRVGECRPLSKITHFIVIKKIKSKDEK